MTSATTPCTPGTQDTDICPRPQFQRAEWVELTGRWSFVFDDHDEGLDSGWASGGFDGSEIRTPFPPESSASGIGDPTPHSVMWYSYSVTGAELTRAGCTGAGERLLLHFGAVDYHATVWLNGHHLGEHEGGHTPFSFDVTNALSGHSHDVLVVRVVDRADDVGQPRGKQDWMTPSRDIWYDRTSGIWQPVWLEAVPDVYLLDCSWTATRACDAITLDVELSQPITAAQLTVHLAHDGVAIAEATVSVHGSAGRVTVELPNQRNGQHYDKLLWSPEHPRLIDARIELRVDGSHDVIDSYVGLRAVAVDRGAFLLNERPYFVRSVLEQGFWPTTHLAAPSPEALRHEVELIKSLGFNAVRLHQKIEDPRFLYWADKLGLLVWGESPAAYEFTARAMARLTREWTEAVLRDRSHPCIVTWVPLNESWGVQHISTQPAQQAFSRGLADLTRALDPSRPVISNDGWEHTRSDILTVHDYDSDLERVRRRYANRENMTELFVGYGPAERRMMADDHFLADRDPVMVTEFGGIRFEAGAHPFRGSWGYTTARTELEFERCLSATFAAFSASPVLAGFCYTQLTDTMQEANGLVDANRVPKIPIQSIRAIVEGVSDSFSESRESDLYFDGIASTPAARADATTGSQ